MSRRKLCLYTCALAISWCCLAASARSQEEISREPVKAEIQFLGGSSVGNFHLVSYSDNRKLVSFGMEYDRHSWGTWIGSKVYYAGEILPVVLLNEPAHYGPNGKAIGTGRQIVYGAGIAPAGIRSIWRKPGQFQPYVTAKGGIVYFQNRVLSTEGTNFQWTGEFGVGIEKAVSNRIAYRLSYEDFHLSNGDIGRHNPGIDFVFINAAVSYRFSKR